MTPTVKCRLGRTVDFDECYQRGLNASSGFGFRKGDPAVKRNPCRNCKLWKQRRELYGSGARDFDETDRDLLKILEAWPDPLTEHGIVIR
jgi:hypothetical protein